MIPIADTRKTYTVEVVVKYTVEVPENCKLTGKEHLFSDNTRLVSDRLSLISDRLSITDEKIKVMRV